MAVKVPVVPNIGAGACAQTVALASKNIGGLSDIGSRVVVPDWKIPIKANEAFKEYLNKYPSGLVSNSVSSKMVSSFEVLSKNTRQLSTLYGVHVKGISALATTMNRIEARDFIAPSQPINDMYNELKRAGALANSFSSWEKAMPNQLDFLDAIGSINLGVEKAGLDLDSSIARKITPDNFRSAVAAGAAESMDDSDSYAPTAEEKSDAISAIQNNTVDKLPSKLKRWTLRLVSGLLKFLFIKLVVTMMCATLIGTNWMYAMEHTIPNETYSHVEESGGKSLGNNYFMKVNAGTPVRIAAKKSSSKIIGYLTKGDTIRACERKGKWIRVEIRDTQTFYGWASQSSVTHINLKGE